MEVIELSDTTPQTIRCLELNSEEWAGLLPLQRYIAREFALRSRIRANGLGHRSFALVSGSGEVLASCEALQRPALAKYGHMRTFETVEYCVASVFVPRPHRRQGYAETLITHVVTKLSDNGNALVTLWSDVGDYYARTGFKFAHPDAFAAAKGATGIHQANSIVWTPKADAPWPSEVEQLDIEQTHALIAEHRRIVVKALDEYEGSGFVTLPHVGLYDQLQYRAEFAAEALGLHLPEVYGARTANGHGWITWTYLLADRKLAIIGVHGSADEIAKLYTAAGAAATGWAEQLGVFAVEMYEALLVSGNTDEVMAAITAQLQGAKLEPRKGSLPMSHSGSLVWISPGKYAWY